MTDDENFGLLMSPSSTSPNEHSPSAYKSSSTQETLDADDDLPINVTGSSDAAPINEREQWNEPHLKYLDCRAVHWPPRAFNAVIRAGFDYATTPSLLFEVGFLGLFVGLCYILPDFMVVPHHRPIPFQTTAEGDALIDLTFANDYHPEETIPGSTLELLCLVFPVCLFAVLGVFLGPRGDFHAALCAYLLAMGMKIFVVACIKNYTGYFRPSFYNMCEFSREKLVCDNETTSARQSFPSGHAATALASMTLVALFLLGKVAGGTQQRLHIRKDSVWDAWTPSLLSKLLAVLSVAPIGLGMFIASSRVRDNWHHPADVVCGGIIGASCALFAHKLWYPSVSSMYAGLPLVTVRRIFEARMREPRLDLEDHEC